MDDGSSPLWAFIVLILFIVSSGILYGFGSAIQKVSEGDIEKRAEENDRKSLCLMQIINNPVPLINTIQAATNLLGILTGYVAIGKLTPYLFRALLKIGVLQNMPKGVLLIISAIFVILAVLIILLSVGVVSMKKVFNRNPEKWVYRTVRIVRFYVKLFTPITFLILKLSNGIVRLFGINPHISEDDVTEEEIISMVDDAHEQGVIEENEAEMIQNIFEFSDTEAQDIMTHRKNIDALDESMTLKEALDHILKGSNSRYPVYKEDIDDIIGILHLKDAMKQMMNGNNGNVPIGEIPGMIRKVSYIPETRNISDLFEKMQAKKIHMAVVVDEYGQTSGIVTMEDILEEIVGNILDEYDEDDNFIEQQQDATLLIEGLTPLEQIEEVLDISFEDEEFETLNGYLTSLLGHIPSLAADKEIRAKGYLFTILGVENNTIQKVRVEKLPKEEGEETCQDIQNSQT